MLVIIDDVLTRDEVAAMRGHLDRAPWATQQSAGPQALLAKHNLQIPESADMLRELRVQVMRALNRSPLLLSAALPLKILPPQLQPLHCGSQPLRLAYRQHLALPA